MANCVIWAIAVVFLALTAATLAILYLRSSLYLINPRDCPKINGAYGAQSQRTAQSLHICGENSRAECKFPAPTLTAAFELCSRNIDICSAFVYDEGSRLVYFVDPRQSSGSASSTLFIRQEPVIFS